MQGLTNGKISIAIMLFLMTEVAFANAEPIRLRSDDILFPVFIDFPIAPELHQMANPTLNNSMIYAYTANDVETSISYIVSIINIPANLGSIPKDTAQTMLAQSLDTQIKTLDDALGIKGQIISSNTESIADYASKHIEIVRNTTPKLYGNYRAVFINRLLVTVWASGLDTLSNRSKAKTFVESLKIKE